MRFGISIKEVSKFDDILVIFSVKGLVTTLHVVPFLELYIVSVPSPPANHLSLTHNTLLPCTVKVLSTEFQVAPSGDTKILLLVLESFPTATHILPFQATSFPDNEKIGPNANIQVNPLSSE